MDIGGVNGDDVGVGVGGVEVDDADVDIEADEDVGNRRWPIRTNAASLLMFIWSYKDRTN